MRRIRREGGRGRATMPVDASATPGRVERSGGGRPVEPEAAGAASSYRVPARCHVCGKDFMARYNVGDRAKVCTPPSHVCKPAKRGQKKIRCVEGCCRSRYQVAASASAMDNAIDPRKVLDPKEYDQVRAAIKRIENPCRAALWFIAETGCRLGESLLLRVGDIQFLEGALSIARIPTLKRVGRPVRSVHIDNSAKDFVKELRSAVEKRPAGEPLFLVHRRALQRALGVILAKDKPSRTSLVHILRHTRASRLSAAGAPWQYIAQQLGWSSLEMAKVYAHTDAGSIAKVLERMR